MWSIERRHFQWPWTTPTPGFKVIPFFDAEYLRNGTRYRQFQWNANRDLHTPCNDTKRRAVSLRQLSFLFVLSAAWDSAVCLEILQSTQLIVSVGTQRHTAREIPLQIIWIIYILALNGWLVRLVQRREASPGGLPCTLYRVQQPSHQGRFYQRGIIRYLAVWTGRRNNSENTEWDETRSSAVAEIPRGAIDYFAKSLEVTQGHSKWRPWVEHV